ncbi:MAG TPA: hypothetical protein VL995_16335 [Cellvibrio sp.]|nr:hypothetical protein [Cellvibrio sp.]
MPINSDNKDLIWDLDAFNQRQRAVDFVMGFENKLCVYSNSVEQLYTNYNIFFPKEEDRKLVILPNPYMPHDTFNNIPAHAVTPTGMEIIPGIYQARPSLFLRIPFRSGTVKYRALPLQMGLKIVREKLPANKPFLPVLMKGDLRELDASTPCLHLHAIHLIRLEDHSVLERGGIQKVIDQRLRQLN